MRARTSTWTLTRTREALERLAAAGLDVGTFQQEALGHLRQAVPCDGWCWTVVDPASLLAAGALAHNAVLGSCQRRFFELEYLTADVNKHADLARDPARVGILSAATGGDLARSARWIELLRAAGIGDELRAALVQDDASWGTLTLYRERASGRFTAAEADVVRALVPLLASGLRHGLVAAPARIEATGAGPGVLLLGADLAPVATTPPAARWLADLQPHQAAPVPSVVYALVARLRALEQNAAPADLARVRLRTPQGRWLVLHAARLTGSGAHGTIAIIIEPAHAAEIVPLLLRAYPLTARERELFALVLHGLPTADLAARLGISAHTVQDHLKAIFAKLGVRSRRALVARVLSQDRMV